MRRFLSAILILALMLCMLPVSLAAASEDELFEDVESTDIAEADSGETEEQQEEAMVDDLPNQSVEIADDFADLPDIEDDPAMDTLSATTVNGVNDSAKLVEALGTDSAELTVNITGNINHNTPISLSRDNQAVTINLRGHTISVNVQGTSILVKDGVSLTINGPGTLNVYCTGTSTNTYSRGIEVSGNGSTFDITGGAIVTSTALGVGMGDYDTVGVYAHSGGTLTVTNVLATGLDGTAVMTEAGGTVNVIGSAIASATGLSYGAVAWGGRINVGGSVSGSYIGAEARDDGVIDITGNLSGTGTERIGSYGALVRSGGKIFVTGNISGMTDDIVINHASWTTRSVSNPTRTNVIILPPQHGSGYYWNIYTSDDSAIVYKRVGELDSTMISNFVTRLYNNVMGRAPDKAGHDYWVERLKKGDVTGAAIAFEFYFSIEFLTKNISNAEYVNNLYRTMLDREADDYGRGIWINQINSGLSRIDLLARFITSEEFAALCAGAGITVGEVKPSNETNIRGFVWRLYFLCLNRAPDEAGLLSWTDVLLRRTRSATQVSREFFFCPEMNNRNLTNAEFVDILYNVMMGRAGDDFGRNTWTGRLNLPAGTSGAMTRLQLFNTFADSSEFSDICARYGIRR